MTAANTGFEPITYTSRDGLRLHARHYPANAAAKGSNACPILCLAGLTRNSRDFHDLAVALANDERQSRPVYSLDYRGRGLSERDPDWRNYAPLVEMHDVADFLDAAGLDAVSLIGTSRGGLVAMLLATARPAAVKAIVFNDIGPVIERDGLARIAGYVGRAPLPGSWPEAAKLVRDMNQRHFPAVPESTWEEVARALYNERGGRPVPGYDPNLSRSLSVLNAPLPALWPQFDALKRIPIMVIRGERSDVLAAATVDEMRRRHPRLISLTVKGQGHAPLLKDQATITSIRRFLAGNESSVELAQSRVA